MKEDNSRLDGKVAIITGAGSSGPGYGVGKATSILFARQGAKVLLVDNNIERANETLKAITNEGGEAAVFKADVSSSQDCAAMVQKAVDLFGKLDILMNNVAVIKTGSVVDVSEADWDLAMDINLKGVMLSCKYAVPQMINSGGGSIINIASVEAVRSGTFAPLTPYSVSKGGIVTLTISMTVQHGRDNIRSNCILPGYIYTPMVAPHLTDEMRDSRREGAPLGTEGTAWDIANASLFLAGEDARWITGIMLPVDAGLLAASPLSKLPYLR